MSRELTDEQVEELKQREVRRLFNQMQEEDQPSYPWSDDLDYKAPKKPADCEDELEQYKEEFKNLGI